MGQETEGLFRAVSDSAKDAIILLDNDERIAYWNPAAEEIFGYTAKEAVGLRLHSLLVPPGLQGSHLDGFAEFKATGRGSAVGKTIELPALRKGGEEFPIELSLSSIRLDGKWCAIGVARDISARKKSEADLQLSLSLLEATLESTADGILVVNAEGKIISFNSKFVEMWRIPHEIIETRNDDEALAFVLDQLSQPEVFLSKVRELYATPEASSYDVLHFKDGRVFERYSQPQRLAGRCVGRVWSFRDVTEARKAAEELRQREERYRILFHQGNDAIFVLRADVDGKPGKFIEVNDVACERLGYTREELLQLTPLDINAPETIEERMKHDRSRLLEDKHHIFEAVHVTKDGRRIPVEVSGHMFVLDGELTNLTICRDLSDRQRAEETMKKLASFPEMNPNPIIEVDGKGRVGYANPAARREFPSLLELNSDHPLLRDLKPWVGDLAGHEGESVSRAIDVDGVWYEQFAYRVSEADLIRIYSVDISESKRKEKILKDSLDKLEKAFEGTIRAMALLLEARDPYTAGHQQRVAELARAIARSLKLPQESVRGIYLAGLVHDIGKIQLPAEILNKPGHLSSIEFGIIKTHAQVGNDILKMIEFPQPIHLIAGQHHERLDGSGYPLGLSGDDIIPEARILAVADVVEAMASHRPYRPALGLDAALDEILRYRGTKYDERAVDACLRLFKEEEFQLEQAG